MVAKSEIAFIRSLAARKEREAAGLFVVEGVKSVGEALDSSLEVRRLLVRQGATLWPDAERVSAKEMERISQLRTPSDVLALVAMPRHPRLVAPGRERLTLVLDEVQDPGNMGTIIRLADWFGIDQIVCSEATVDCFSPKVVQATMGAFTRVGVYYQPLEPLLTAAVADGVPVYGTFLCGDDIYQTSLTAHGLIVMGNEGRGITAPVEAMVTHRLYVPPFPADRHATESLNVAVATAVVCAEFRRRMGDAPAQVLSHTVE